VCGGGAQMMAKFILKYREGLSICRKVLQT